MNLVRDALKLYDEKIALEACRHIANGKNISDLIAMGVIPSESTLFLWAEGRSDFAQELKLAFKCQAHVLASSTMAISRDMTIPLYDRKLAVATSQWLAGKYAPEIYGMKDVIEQANALANLTDEELAQKKQMLLERVRDMMRGDVIENQGKAIK